MFFDEAGFGRINKPKSCYITGKVRPSVPCHHVREYRYAYGAVDPVDGENFFIAAPHCNSAWTHSFFEELSKAYPDDYIILVMDSAAWHKSKKLEIPPHIQRFYNQTHITYFIEPWNTIRCVTFPQSLITQFLTF